MKKIIVKLAHSFLKLTFQSDQAAAMLSLYWFVTRALIGQTRLPEADFSPEYTNQIAPFKFGRVNRTFVPSINTMAIRTAFRRRRLF